MTKKYGMLSVGLVFLSLVGLIFFSYGWSNPFTPAGHEGFVYENPRVFGKGGFRGAIKGPGNYGASLWRNQIINIDMRPETYLQHEAIQTQLVMANSPNHSTVYIPSGANGIPLVKLVE